MLGWTLSPCEKQDEISEIYVILWMRWKHIDKIECIWMFQFEASVCWRNCWSTYLSRYLFRCRRLCPRESLHYWWIFLVFTINQEICSYLFTNVNIPTLSKLPWTLLIHIFFSRIPSSKNQPWGGGNNKRVRRPPIQAVSEKEVAV